MNATSGTGRTVQAARPFSRGQRHIGLNERENVWNILIGSDCDLITSRATCMRGHCAATWAWGSSGFLVEVTVRLIILDFSSKPSCCSYNLTIEISLCNYSYIVHRYLVICLAEQQTEQTHELATSLLVIICCFVGESRQRAEQLS